MAIVLFLSLIFSTPTVIAETLDKNERVSQSLMFSDYENYLLKNTDIPYAEEPVSVSFENLVSENAEITVENGTVTWNGGKGNFVLDFECKKSALYNIEIVWRALETGVDIELGLELDSQTPYGALENAVLRRMWKNSTDTPIIDDKGNQYAPEQTESDDYIETVLQDSTGAIAEPYLVAVSEGMHTITVSNPEQSIAIKSIRLIPPEQTKKYSANEMNVVKTNADIIEIQGETAALKNGNNIIPKSDNRNAGMTPSDSKNQKINYYCFIGF